MSNEMSDTEKLIQRITAGRYQRIAGAATAAGLDPARAKAAVESLVADRVVRVEPEPMAFRVTAADALYAPVIGGDACHLIKRV